MGRQLVCHRTFLSYFQLDKSYKELLIGASSSSLWSEQWDIRFAAPTRATGRSVEDSQPKPQGKDGRGKIFAGQGAHQRKPEIT